MARLLQSRVLQLQLHLHLHQADHANLSRKNSAISSPLHYASTKRASWPQHSSTLRKHRPLSGGNLTSDPS